MAGLESLVENTGSAWPFPAEQLRRRPVIVKRHAVIVMNRRGKVVGREIPPLDLTELKKRHHPSIQLNGLPYSDIDFLPIRETCGGKSWSEAKA